jgi:hypothetical protein
VNSWHNGGDGFAGNLASRLRLERKYNIGEDPRTSIAMEPLNGSAPSPVMLYNLLSMECP